MTTDSSRLVTHLKKGFKPINKQPKPSLTFNQRLRILRMRARIERMKLQNQMRTTNFQIQKPKLNLPSHLVLKPMPLQRPRFFNSITNADVDSAFYSDIGHSDGNLWGNESYHDENDFFNENFLGNEDFFNVGIKIGANRSPLLW